MLTVVALHFFFFSLSALYDIFRFAGVFFFNAHVRLNLSLIFLQKERKTNLQDLLSVNVRKCFCSAKMSLLKSHWLITEKVRADPAMHRENQQHRPARIIIINISGSVPVILRRRLDLWCWHNQSASRHYKCQHLFHLQLRALRSDALHWSQLWFWNMHILQIQHSLSRRQRSCSFPALHCRLKW